MTKRNTVAIISLLALMFASMLSCTKVDNALGNDFIPDDQKMKIGIDTIFGIEAFLARQDSFPSSNLTEGIYVGALTTKKYGQLTAGTVVQYNWDAYSFEDLKTKFGTAAKVDSLKLVLTFSGYGGDTSKMQTFNVYELKERIFQDSAYYANFDAKAISENEPLFSFEYQGAKKVNIRMTGSKVEALANQLIDTTGGTYTSDSMFYKKFKGLYIVPADASAKDASISSFGWTDSRLELHTHNYTDLTAQTRKDTMSINYYFTILNGAPNGSVCTFTYDYSGTEITGVNDTLPTSLPITVGYLQGFGGLSTYLRLSEGFVSDLKSKIQAPYKSMVINNARIEFELSDPTLESLKRTVGRVGMYKSLIKTLNPITDYNYTYEDTYGGSLPYGGYLNRTHNNYTMDISGFIQKIVQSNDKNARNIMLAPARNYIYGFGDAALKTPFDPNDPKRMRVIVTYTLIR